MTPVKKNDVIETEIDGMGYDGEGIAHVGGFAVFIRYALPGEKVRAKIIFVKPTFAVGKLESVLRSSPDRAQPFCAAYYRCGGCSMQHMTYAAQLRRKQEAVRETFRKVAHMAVAPDETVPSPLRQAYRNKMSLPVRGEEAVVGFFAEGTHRVVPIEECPIQFEDNAILIRAFTEFLHRNRIAGYNETTHEGVVRHLVVRRLDDFTAVTVVANGRHTKCLAPFDTDLRALYGDKYAFYINYNTSDGNRILGTESDRIGGENPNVSIDGLRVRVHPQSFFQVNDGIRALLYAEVCHTVRAASVVDAYSGAGVLSALLARSAKTVTAIEIEPTAVASAKSLCDVNGIGNVTCLCGDCAQLLPRILPQEKEDFTLVLDPPRAGCDRAVLSAALTARPAQIVYISCNPATLARDAAVLCESAYEITRLTPFDMFPHSGNVETLCVLSKKNRQHKRGPII